MNKVRVATLWLDGCSGCHMSLLDMDERLIALTEKIEIVYSPLVDTKEFPQGVDLTVIEGGISSEEDLEKIRTVRANTKVLLALGDCAITGNVPAMRNTFPVSEIFKRVYEENSDFNQEVKPVLVVPALLPKSRPVHEFVAVDAYLPGCPPPADAIFFALSELSEGRVPELGSLSRFGR
ncbi:MAG: NADP oxidoreductase [Acidobacteria bacterium]|nr:NADP oxidoreductase [Acidobacteriota bacterium]MCG3193197.1 NAD-reducing hydrogenase HoxS subunit delta [Thermoanaerobaculia bacterium]MCK6683389.1 NADP oxidoreductase [Thermoanaerobaculia bacterium]